MLLDCLKDFEWLNEPDNVRFNDEGMLVCTKGKTDFWQASHHNFHRDNGHFFYSKSCANFGFVTKWQVDEACSFDQCGLMVRVDNLNWFKIGAIFENSSKIQIGTSVTSLGYSDLSSQELIMPQKFFWFKVLRRSDDYILSYSLDGENYIKTRMFHFLNSTPEIKVGVYACSPQRDGFCCTLESLKFD